MTPQELITKLVNMEGDCGRFCAYCPDCFDTGEAKECVEELQRLVYVRDEVVSDLTKELIKIRKAYHRDTGKEYKDEDH